MDKDELARSDDLAFVRLVALGRARRLPEAIAAADDFERQRFPAKPVGARGAALRQVLALVDNHQAGIALSALYRLRKLDGITGQQRHGITTTTLMAPVLHTVSEA